MSRFTASRTRRVRLVSLLVPATFAVGILGYAGPASAAPRHGGKSAVVSSATLSAPASVSVGSSFHVSGTGYDPSQQAWVQVTTSSSSGWMSASVDSFGNLSLDLTVYSSGTVTLTAQQGGVTMATASTSAS